jgi:acetyl esterase/lipase
MKIGLSVLAFLCILVAVLQFYTLPTEPLWPASMIAREIWPWFIVANVIGIVLASIAWRPMTLAFVVCLIASCWPLTQRSRIAEEMQRQWNQQALAGGPLRPAGLTDIFRNAFGGYPDDAVVPEVLPLNIHLYRASKDRASKLRPILVNIHGGSWQRGGPTDDATFTSHFAGKGWTVFSIDYRLAPQSIHPAQIDDVHTALRWIHTHAAEYGGDPARIALAGRSAGGHLALLAAYAGSDVPIRSVVSYYAPIDLAGGYADPPVPDPLRVRERLAVFLGGTPTEIADRYRDASPITYVRSGLPATFQILGAHDCVVKPRFPKTLHERLLEQNNRSLLLEIPWSDHGFDFVYFGAGNTLVLPYIEAFLDATT